MKECLVCGTLGSASVCSPGCERKFMQMADSATEVTKVLGRWYGVQKAIEMANGAILISSGFPSRENFWKMVRNKLEILVDVDMTVDEAIEFLGEVVHNRQD